MKKAIVTLVVGEKYLSNYAAYCERTWAPYARRHGHDLILIKEPLDLSQRAAKRSPAWQKCLILSHHEVSRYEQVAWVDSDILINPESPDLFAGVPVEKMGAVDAYATPNKEDYQVSLSRKYAAWARQGVPFLKNLTASQYHENYGLGAGMKGVVQTGVFTASPRHHRPLLEHVYHAYEEKGDASFNYEMRPLSYEIQRNGVEFWINPKFNMIWSTQVQLHYPFLIEGRPSIARRLARGLGFEPEGGLRRRCATAAFRNNYFLHFAGAADQMRFVDAA